MTDTPRWAGRAATQAKNYTLARDGWTCQLCGHHGANSLDHITPTDQRPDLMWDPSNHQAVHLQRAGKPKGCQHPGCSCVGNYGKAGGSNAAAIEASRAGDDGPEPSRVW